MRAFHLQQTKKSIERGGENVKRPIRRRTKTDTCQGARYISHEQRRGVVSTLWEGVGGWEGELAGYAKVLLRACDAHGTRVPSMRPGERQRTCLERTAFGLPQDGWCSTVVEAPKGQVELLGRHFGKTRRQRMKRKRTS